MPLPTGIIPLIKPALVYLQTKVHLLNVNALQNLVLIEFSASPPPLPLSAMTPIFQLCCTSVPKTGCRL